MSDRKNQIEKAVKWWYSLPVQAIYSDPWSHAYFCNIYFPEKDDCNSLTDEEIFFIYIRVEPYKESNIKTRRYLSACDALLHVRISDTVMQSLAYYEAGEELDTNCIKLVDDLKTARQRLDNCISELRDIADMDPIHTTCDDFGMYDFVRINGVKLYFSFFMTSEGWPAMDRVHTKFWKDFKTITTKKYIFFGPKIEKQVPDYLFSVEQDIRNQSLTKGWWQKRLSEEFERLGRAEEISNKDFI